MNNLDLQLWRHRSPSAEDFRIDLAPQLWCYGSSYAGGYYDLFGSATLVLRIPLCRGF